VGFCAVFLNVLGNILPDETWTNAKNLLKKMKQRNCLIGNLSRAVTLEKNQLSESMPG
jgi:hypothetical protein